MSNEFETRVMVSVSIIFALLPTTLLMLGCDFQSIVAPVICILCGIGLIATERLHVV